MAAPAFVPVAPRYGSGAGARSIRFRRRRRWYGLLFGLFFNFRPALLLPSPDLIFVALQRTPHRTLATPSQLPQYPPSLRGMILDSAFLLDQMGHAPRSPQTGFVTQRLRSAF